MIDFSEVHCHHDPLATAYVDPPSLPGMRSGQVGTSLGCPAPTSDHSASGETAKLRHAHRLGTLVLTKPVQGGQAEEHFCLISGLWILQMRSERRKDSGRPILFSPYSTPK